MEKDYEVLEKQEVPRNNKERNKLHKSSKDALIFGVCGGLAEYLGIDSSIIRILIVLLTFLVDGSKIVLLYFLLAFILPKK